MKNRIIISLFLLVAFCAAPVFAQETSASNEDFVKAWKLIKERRQRVSEEKAKEYCTAGFVGEPINLNITNADFRDILVYITDEYGFDFAIDKSLNVKPVTMKIDNTPWNIVLDKILKENGLAIQCNGQILRVIEIKKLDDGMICSEFIEEKPEPLYTEIIKLKNLPIFPNGSDTTIEQGFIAFNQLKKIISRRLSKRGLLEYDQRSQTLVITDIRANLDSIKNLIELLDDLELYNQTEKDK